MIILLQKFKKKLHLTFLVLFIDKHMIAPKLGAVGMNGYNKTQLKITRSTINVEA